MTVGDVSAILIILKHVDVRCATRPPGFALGSADVRHTCGPSEPPAHPEEVRDMSPTSLPLASGTSTATTPRVTIRWQRLVGEQGGTCARCGGTETEVQQATAQLERSLAALGVTVVLEQQSLDVDTFIRDVAASNRIWINDRPLEDWLGADVGASSCTFCCTEAGVDVECRTVVHDGRTFETIPASLIVQAGLMAAAHTLSATTTSCCSDSSSAPAGGCCS